MTPPRSPYDNPQVAAAYAYARPPVHQLVVQRIQQSLHSSQRVHRALDVGCGAGLSTAALVLLAGQVVGLEPVRAMLACSCDVAPGARFAVGMAERLPFAAGAFDLVTAAGAVNYTDPDQFLPEVARVLAPGGLLAIYDFSAGRRFRSSRALDEWYAAFEERYPPAPGYALDVRTLGYTRAGLRLDAFETFEAAVPLNVRAYLLYVMSSSSVQLAISRGAPADEVRRWCESTLAQVFNGSHPADVLFDCYIASVKCSNADQSVRPHE